MSTPSPEVVKPLKTEADVVLFRQAVRARTAEMKFSLVEQTKIVTAVSEIARNALIYGGGGLGKFEILEAGGKIGLQLTIVDEGPGIGDLKQAFTDGFTSGGGMGLGLGGAKRLMDNFAIDTAPGKGTKITMTKWKNR